MLPLSQIGPFHDKERIIECNDIGATFWVHENCAAFCPEVSQDPNGQWFNVTKAMKRGRKLNCTHCNARGSTVGCNISKCRNTYHGRCAALFTSWDFDRSDQGKHYYCPKHRTQLLSTKVSGWGVQFSFLKSSAFY